MNPNKSIVILDLKVRFSRLNFTMTDITNQRLCRCLIFYVSDSESTKKQKEGK